MKYELTALTPFLVGDGQTLSPIDYMVWKDQINVLDQARIFKLLARGPRLEGYLGQLRKATKLDFASWGGFAQNFSQRRIPFEDAGSTSLWEAAPAEAQFIPTFAANHRGPYVPGSAIKGALRTGLVFSRWNTSTMEKIAAGLENDRVPRRVAEPAEAAAGASQMRIISVVDSAATDTSSFRIYVSKVASLDTRQPGKPQLVWKSAGRGSVPPQRVKEATPTFSEMAKPGTVFSGQWQERKYLENPDLTRALGWRSVPDPKMIFAAANEYASAQLALHARHAEVAGLVALYRSIERIQGEVSTAQQQASSCVLCLGWGGGFLSKTGFPNTEDESYRKILKNIPVFGRAVRDGLPFPKTRRVVFVGGQPATLPGWVRLQLKD